MHLRNEIFANIYDWLRNNKGIRDQKDLALRTGIGENTIANILNGRNKVSDKTFQKLNSAFGNIFNPAYMRGTDPLHMLLADCLQPIMPHQEKTPILEDNAPIPAWADSLIHLVTDNTVAVQALRDENRMLRELLAAVVADNRKLRADLTNYIQILSTSRRGAKYSTEPAPLLMAAENESLTPKK